MTIELLKKEEIPELLELYKELGDFEMDLEESKKAYDKMLSDENYYLLVAKEDDKIIGTVLGIVCHLLLILGKPFMVVEDVVVKKNTGDKE